jgi:formylmethanofuran dehydrogenase subunit E
MRKSIGLLFLLGFSFLQLFAHTGKPDYHVVIDTDGGPGQMRAITMLLSANSIRVLAISCTRGTPDQETVCQEVRSLLSAFHHEGIPVVASAEGLNRVLEDYPDPLTLVALGLPDTYAGWIREHPAMTERIGQVICPDPGEGRKGTSGGMTDGDLEFLRASGLNVILVAGGREDLFAGRAYRDQLKGLDNRYSGYILETLSSPSGEPGTGEGPALAADFIPLYLSAPVLFGIEAGQGTRVATVNADLPPVFIYETIRNILESSDPGNNRVFTSFPVEPDLYKKEVASILPRTLAKYGREEWKAITLTNEIHGHTGIYSIIGAKMGIRALEYFNLGVNSLEVLTFAGNSPPLSCLNDGIQVSSGATVGQGLITVSDSISSIPSAVFAFNGRKVHFSLDPEIAARMKREIRYGVEQFGLSSAQYWLYIEQLALRYWSEMDRHEIFIIREISL